MIFTARQFRARDYYLTQNGLRLELQLRTTPKTVYMTEKATGKSVTVEIKTILGAYDGDRKEAARERSRARRQEKARARR